MLATKLTCTYTCVWGGGEGGKAEFSSKQLESLVGLLNHDGKVVR